MDTRTELGTQSKVSKITDRPPIKLNYIYTPFSDSEVPHKAIWVDVDVDIQPTHKASAGYRFDINPNSFAVRASDGSPLDTEWNQLYGMTGEQSKCVVVTNGESKGHITCKHAIGCQYRACTGPMLVASVQYRPGTVT